MVGEKYYSFLEKIFSEIRKGKVKKLERMDETNPACFFCGKRIEEEIYLVEIHEENSITKTFLDERCYLLGKNFFYTEFGFFSIN